MPKVQPLSAERAKHSLANRLGTRVDRLRQIATNLGIRPYRVFLVWEKYSGEERGVGDPIVVARHEILPTPKVSGIDSVARNPFGAGMLPVGSIRLDRVSTSMTRDELCGLMIPGRHEDHIPEPYSFYYEVIEDGRGDPCPLRDKYRLAATPMRQAGRVSWVVVLERESEDNQRNGSSRYGDGT